MNLRSVIVSGLAVIAMPTLAADTLGSGKDDKRPGANFFKDEMSSFMAFNNLEARIRAVEFNRKYKSALSKGSETKRHERGADALGVQLNFKSGWFADAVGFDASLYTVGDLHSPNPDTRQLLIETASGNRTGYSKLAQAYIKAKLQPDDEEPPLLTFKGGRERIYTGLIAGSGSRATPSAWRGIDLKGEYEGLSYGFAWVDQNSLRNSSNFEDLKSFKKKGAAYGTNLSNNSTTNAAEAEQIDNVWGAELGYEIMGLSLKYRDSHAKDFLYTYNIDASYNLELSPELDLTFNAKYYKEKEDGELWTGYVWGSPAFNKDANLKHFNVTADLGDLMLILGYTKTEAKYRDASGNQKLGSYYYDFGMNTHGGFDVPTSMMTGDFFYDQEKAWIIGAGYDFAEFVPGLATKVYHTRGKDFKGYNGEKLKEHETDFDIIYKFQQPVLSGLSLRFRYAMYRPDGKKDADNDFASGSNAYRAYIDYKTMVF